MGNPKYPLNGKYMSLEDLVSEFAFNTVITKEKENEHNKSINNAILSIIDNSGSFIDIKEYCAKNDIKDNFIYDISINNATPIETINTSTLINSYYVQFKEDLRDQNNERTEKPYTLCYFTDVYSNKKRNKDNTQYEIIQCGDYDLFAPDRIMKFKDVILSDTGNRLISLFHYIVPLKKGTNVINSNKDLRFSFNYKLDTGEATASYALRQLYELNDDFSSIVNSPSNKTNLYVGYVTGSGDVLILNAPLHIDYFIFGLPNDTSPSTLYTNAPSNINASNHVPVKDPGLCSIYVNRTPDYNLIYRPLLYDISIYKDDIRNKNYTLSKYAYKFLLNENIRKSNRYIYDTNGIKVSYDNIYNASYDDNFVSSTSWNNMIQTLLNIVESDSTYTNSYYFEYDNTILYKEEGTVLKRYNLYWKIIYYGTLLVNAQCYKTGIVLDAIFDVINEKHIYMKESPLYRCDIGADTNITSVVWNIANTNNIKGLIESNNIITNYGLPARTLVKDDKISISIPVKVDSNINTTGLLYNKTWTILQIIQLFKVGFFVNRPDISIDTKIENNDSEYMKLIVLDGKDSKFYDFELISNIEKVITLSLSTHVYSLDNTNIPKAQVYDKNLVLSTSPYNIYNPTTNPAINSYMKNGILLNIIDKLVINFFAGYIFAHIKYNGKLFECIFPIMRLLNYYYTERVVEGRALYIYFDSVPLSYLDMGNTTPLKYVFKENSQVHTLTATHYILNDLEMTYYIISQDNVYNRYTFISDPDHPQSSLSETPLCQDEILINGNSCESIVEGNNWTYYTLEKQKEHKVTIELPTAEEDGKVIYGDKFKFSPLPYTSSASVSINNMSSSSDYSVLIKPDTSDNPGNDNNIRPFYTGFIKQIQGDTVSSANVKYINLTDTCLYIYASKNSGGIKLILKIDNKYYILSKKASGNITIYNQVKVAIDPAATYYIFDKPIYFYRLTSTNIKVINGDNIELDIIKINNIEFSASNSTANIKAINDDNKCTCTYKDLNVSYLTPSNISNDIDIAAIIRTVITDNPLYQDYEDLNYKAIIDTNSETNVSSITIDITLKLKNIITIPETEGTE